jgi:hypothetical protein
MYQTTRFHITNDCVLVLVNYTKIMYWFSFPVVKRPRRGVKHPPPSSTEVQERVELYLYSLSRVLWLLLGQTLPYLLYKNKITVLNKNELGLKTLFSENIT